MRNPKVKKAVRARMTERKNRTEVTQDYVLDVIVETVERCSQRKPVLTWQVVDGHRQLAQAIDPDNGAHIWSFNSTGVLRGAELLGKHLAMFTDRTEITNTDRGDAIEQARHRVIESAIEQSKEVVK